MSGNVGVQAKVYYNNFNSYSKRVQSRAAQRTIDTAQKLIDQAASSAPVRTGQLAAGHYMIVNGPGDVTVTNKMDYFPYVIGGTRFMPANPYFSNAVEAARQEFPRAIGIEVAASS